MQTQEINPLYINLLTALADLNQLKHVVNQAFKREFNALEDYKKNDGKPDVIVSTEAFVFDNPFSGNSEMYASRTMTVEDLSRAIYWHKNRQYCWLLVSAYEEFERFINAAYQKSVGDKPKKWTLNKALSHFTNTYQSIKSREEENTFKIHLRVAVHLIEKMRHVITHNQSKVTDEERLYQKIIRDSGIRDTNYYHRDFILQYIFEERIFILEVPQKNHPIFNLYHDQYRILVNYLIAYAYLVNDAAT